MMRYPGGSIRNSIYYKRKLITDGGRVSVYVRTRPLPLDDPTGIPSLLFPDVTKVIVQEVKHDTIYKFDHVFPLDSTNAEVSKVISEPLVSAVLSGNNGCFLVYGQTGAGKTHTVLYSGGVIPATIEHILDNVRNSNQSTYKVFLSYLQIYQERIYDLLIDEGTGPLTLREHPQEGIIIEGLLEEEVTCKESAKQLIAIGQKKLIVTHTKASPFSSRSHAVCILKVCKYFNGHLINPGIPSDVSCEDVPTSPVEYECGKLHICDLAGTERSTKLRTTSGRRLDESRHINTSLLELGNVIHALATKKNPYIPFRNSCLTRILQESLGGHSKASLMVCISASVSDLKETKCSLNFGQRAMKVMKETITNSETQLDPRMLSDSFTRKKLKKTDYKILSKYLTAKLKELELAYKLEKDNLDALKKKKSEKEENDDDSLQQDSSISTPLILERSLGAVNEEFTSQEHITAQFMSSSCQVDFGTYVTEQRYDPELIERVTVNETMAESLLIEKIFNPEDTLPFQMVEAASVTNGYNGTKIDDVVNAKNSNGTTTTHTNQEKRISETPIIMYNFNYMPSQEDIDKQIQETVSHVECSKAISIAVGTSIEDIHKLCLGGQSVRKLSDIGVQTEGIPTKNDSCVGTTHNGTDDENALPCASTQFEASNCNGISETDSVINENVCHTTFAMSSCDNYTGERDNGHIQINNINNISPNEHNHLTHSNMNNSELSVKLLPENNEKSENDSCNDGIVVEFSMKDLSSACYSEKNIQNGTKYDCVMEDSPSLENGYYLENCKQSDGNDSTDNMTTLKPSELIICNNKIETDVSTTDDDGHNLELQSNKHSYNDEINVDKPESSSEQSEEQLHDKKRNLDTANHVLFVDSSKSDEETIGNIQTNDTNSEETSIDLEKQTECAVDTTQYTCNTITLSICQIQPENDLQEDVGVDDHISNNSEPNRTETLHSKEVPSKEACSTDSEDVIAGNNEDECTSTKNPNPVYEVQGTHCQKEIYHDVDISCNINIDNIENDVVVQEELKEQFVDQLCSYIWENMEIDNNNNDNSNPLTNINVTEGDQITKVTEAHDCITEIIKEINENDIDCEDVKDNESCSIEVSAQQCQECTSNEVKVNHQVMDIGDYNAEIKVANVKRTVKQKDFDIRNINDNDITEVHINDIMIKFNNSNTKKNTCDKREMCVQTDETYMGQKRLFRYGNGRRLSSPQSYYKGGSPPSECDEERERFMNRFCYSASQHLSRDMDFEHKEAKYVTSDGENDELYQGCLVYLTDTDSISDYSEISEDSSFFSDSLKSDGDSDETLRAKLLMENIKNKYEMLLNDFDLVSSERSRLQGESTRKRNCYDLLTNFKSALEEELTKLGEESGRSSVCDNSDSVFTPCKVSKSNSSLGAQDSKPVKPVKRHFGNVEVLPLERTSPDGEQQKTPAKKLDTVEESFDENNNIKNPSEVRWDASCRGSENNTNKEICKTNKTSYQELLQRYTPVRRMTSTHKSLSTTGTHDACKSLEGTPSTYRRMPPSLYNRSMSMQEQRIDDHIEVDSMDHEKLKRELMLTKLEKSRLEAVLSCVLLTNDVHIDSDSNLKNLTMSRSTLASSTSMSQLAKGSRTSSPSPFQNITIPMKSYTYKGRRFGTPDSLPALSNLAEVVRSREETKSRSIPETNCVGDWLNGGNTMSTSGMRSLDGSTISPSSSFAEITSMSDMETPSVSTQQLYSHGQDNENLMKDLSLDKDLDDVDIDNLLEQLQKSEKSPLACVPFIKRRSIRKKLKKAKKLCESQSSGIS